MTFFTPRPILADPPEISLFVAKASKLGLSPKETYHLAVRLYVIDLDELRDALENERVAAQMRQAATS